MRYVSDGDGRLKYLKEETDIILAEYRYTDAGRIKEITTKVGIRSSFICDEDGNISRLTIGDSMEEGMPYGAFMLYDLNGNRMGNRKQGRWRRETDRNGGFLPLLYFIGYD